MPHMVEDVVVVAPRTVNTTAGSAAVVQLAACCSYPYPYSEKGGRVKSEIKLTIWYT